MKSGRRIALCGALALGWLVTPPAFAFRSAGQVEPFTATARVRWADGHIPYRLHARVPAGLSFVDVEQAVREAMLTWTAPACSGVAFDYRGATWIPAAAGDGVSTVEWVSSGWDDRGFDPNAAGVSDVQYARMNGGDWTIVEADVYINAQHFRWVLGGSPPYGFRDVRSVLTHEAGHVLGLMHPCEPGGRDGAPDCADDTSFATTTMFPLYDPRQAMLSEDDVVGACFLYPRTCDGGPCPPSCPEGGCADPGNWVDGGGQDPAKRCNVDDDCDEQGERCLESRCTAAPGHIGDPCAGDHDCGGGTCLDGHCAMVCERQDDCPSRLTCSASEGTTGICGGQLKPAGAVCDNALQCAGGQCIAGVADQAQCTRPCGGRGFSTCPALWSCEVVDGRSVCAPPPPGGAGCSIVRAPASQDPSGILLGGAAAALFTWTRRRRRARNPRTPTPNTSPLLGGTHDGS